MPRGTIGPVTVEGDRLWDLLRSLDDPKHLETPADFNFDETKNRFRQLVDRLNTAFSCAREADGSLQDTTYFNRVEIPAAVTATERPLWVVVSNFGGLAVVVADNSYALTQEEFTELLHPDDAQRIYTALDDLGYTVVPEEPLWEDYDGDVRSGATPTGNHPPGGSGSSATCDLIRGGPGRARGHTEPLELRRTTRCALSWPNSGTAVIHAHRERPPIWAGDG